MNRERGGERENETVCEREKGVAGDTGSGWSRVYVVDTGGSRRATRTTHPQRRRCALERRLKTECPPARPSRPTRRRPGFFLPGGRDYPATSETWSKGIKRERERERERERMRDRERERERMREREREKENEGERGGEKREGGRARQR